MQPHDTNLHYLLGQIGLTLNEAQVYLYLLSSKDVEGTQIYSDLRMDKSSCYRALNTLIQRELIIAVGEERNRLFSAAPLKKLDDLVENEESKLKQTKIALSQIKQSLDTYLSQRYHNRRIKIINDSEGYYRYFEARLHCQSKLIRDMSGRMNSEIYFKDYDQVMADYIGRRVKMNIFLRQLSHPDQVDTKWDKTSRELKKEVRLLPNDFQTEAVFSVWDDKSAVFSKEEGKIIGVVIEDPLISDLLISMFDYIWNNQGK